MKKSLLIAAAFMTAAFTVNAQGSYLIQVDQIVTGGETVESVEGIKLTFGQDTYAAGKADSKAGDPYVAYVGGSNNPVDADGQSFDASGALPVTGCYYTFEVSKNGTLQFGVVLNANKKFFIVEDQTAMADYNGITVDTKYQGTYEVEVSAGKPYTVFCTGSKLGFHGFVFTTSGEEEQPGTGIDAAAAGKTIIATEYYTVAGVKVAEPVKGINLIKNTMEDGTVEVIKTIVR